MEGSQGEPTTEQRQKFDQNNPRCLWSEVRRFSKRHKKAHICSRPSFMIMLSHEMPSWWCKSSCSGENIREVRWGFGYRWQHEGCNQTGSTANIHWVPFDTIDELDWKPYSTLTEACCSTYFSSHRCQSVNSGVRQGQQLDLIDLHRLLFREYTEPVCWE